MAKDLSDVTLSQFAGKRKVLNIFPSIDTGVCAASVRKFNQLAAELDNTVVLCISADLPFAQSRFCGAEGLSNVVTLSTLRGADFLARLRRRHRRPVRWQAWLHVRWSLSMKTIKVVYSQLVNEITERAGLRRRAGRPESLITDCPGASRSRTFDLPSPRSARAFYCRGA